MSIKIAFCDDEPAQFIYLKQLMEQWEEKQEIGYEITYYKSAEEMLFENPDSFPFDLLLLDIELEKMNGITLAKMIREKDESIMIAFLSNRKEYVFEGYEVQAIRYLLKPLQEEQFFPLLRQLEEQKNTKKKYLIVRSEREEHRINVQDIFYLESVGHYIHIHTKEKVYEVKGSLSQLIEENEMKNFVSTHRSYVVNLDYVERVTKNSCILENGEEVLVSRNRYQAVNLAFIEYYSKQ